MRNALRINEFAVASPRRHLEQVSVRADWPGSTSRRCSNVVPQGPLVTGETGFPPLSPSVVRRDFARYSSGGRSPRPRVNSDRASQRALTTPGSAGASLFLFPCLQGFWGGFSLPPPQTPGSPPCPSPPHPLGFHEADSVKPLR